MSGWTWSVIKVQKDTNPMHKDYFGNEIKVGDIILRNCGGITYTSQVLKIRKSDVGIRRRPWQRYKGDWKNKPLYVANYNIPHQIINLSRLDSSNIDLTIKNYINEI